MIRSWTIEYESILSSDYPLTIGINSPPPSQPVELDNLFQLPAFRVGVVESYGAMEHRRVVLRD